MLRSVGPNARQNPSSAQFADTAGCQLTKHESVVLTTRVSYYFKLSIPSIDNTTNRTYEIALSMSRYSEATS